MQRHIFPHLYVYFSSSVTNCSSIFHICTVKEKSTTRNILIICAYKALLQITWQSLLETLISYARNYDSWMTSKISWSVAVLHCNNAKNQKLWLRCTLGNLMIKLKTSTEINQALLYVATIQVMRAAKSKKEKQIINIKIKIMHRMQQMPLVYK